MKKLLFSLLAIVLLSFTVNAQSACSSDCLLGECRIKCDGQSTATCNCIIGMFSSCKCSEKVMTSLTAAFSEKQNSNAIKVLNYLKSNKLDSFYPSIKGAIEALKSLDTNSYYENLDALELIISKYPEEASKIEGYVNSLK